VQGILSNDATVAIGHIGRIICGTIGWARKNTIKVIRKKLLKPQCKNVNSRINHPWKKTSSIKGLWLHVSLEYYQLMFLLLF
jgi:hypothetical protein